MNWYAYVGDDPVNKTDPTGALCVIPGGAFCANAWVYQAIQSRPAISAKTDYFGAVALMADNLGSLSQPGGARAAGVSGPVYNALSTLSTSIRQFNEGQANRVIDGSISGTRDQVNRQLVREEQRFITGQLNEMKARDSALYGDVISTLNKAANPDLAMGLALGATAPSVSAAANETREALGRDIDFANESDRVRMGDNLVRRAAR
jgi:hypothetical protein